MPTRRTSPDIATEVYDPCYRENLQNAVGRAKDLLWERIRYGLYRDDEEAKAVMDAYWALKKVQRLLEEKIRQVPLPIKEEEELPPAPAVLLPQEVASDPTPAP